MRKIIFLLLILLTISAVSQVSAADDNSTIICNNENTLLANTSNTHYLNSGDDIQTAVDLASAGDTLVLNGSFELNKTVTVNKTLNIMGSGDGASIELGEFVFSNQRFFEIDSTASGVVFNNLKFISGISNDYGGAILWQGSNGTISNCEFSKNTAAGSSGGAVTINADNCNITNCSFSKNHAYQNGGAIVILANNCLVSNCYFNENYASVNGGAIFAGGKKNTVVNSKFKSNYLLNSLDNSSLSYGGAIFSSCEGLTIDNCTFDENIVYNGYGGAISLYEYNTVQYSSFDDNTALKANDIYSNASSWILSNYFVINENETKEDALYQMDLMILLNNTFNITKASSSITFSAGMVFSYGSSGSIYVTVEGGTISLANICVLNHSEAKITYSNNIVTVSNLAVGKYTLRVTTTPDEYHYAINSDLSITVNKATATIKASKITVALKKSTKWSITIIDSKSGKGIANMKLTLKVYTGSKYKTVSIKTNSKGIATYQTKGLSKGSHKIIVSATHSGYNFKTLTSSIKVVKAKKLKYKVSHYKLKDGSTIMFKVLNKKTKKAVNGVKLYLKIYTGKKVVKTITLKSKTYKKNKGIVGYTTNELTAGKHKVVLVPANVKYSGSKKSTLKITKKQKKYSAYSAKISAK